MASVLSVSLRSEVFWLVRSNRHSGSIHSHILVYTKPAYYRRLTSQNWPACYHGNKQSSVQSYRYWSPPCALEISAFQRTSFFSLMRTLTLLFFLLSVAAAAHLKCGAWQWQNTWRYRTLLSQWLCRSCWEILPTWPFPCNINQNNLYWGWLIKLSAQYIGTCSTKKRHGTGVFAYLQACSYPSAAHNSLSLA